MKIAFFVQYAHKAGTYFRWHNLALALLKQGHVVHVYAGDFSWRAKSREELRDGIVYKITPSLVSSTFINNPSDPLSAIRRCFVRVEEQYDVYHLFQPFLQAALPWYFLKLFRKGLFVYDWDDLWTNGLHQSPKTLKERYIFSLVSFLEQRLPRMANLTTVCSGFLANQSCMVNKPVQVLYNGFWSKALPDERNALRTKWGLAHTCFYIAYIGKTSDELNWIATAIQTYRAQLSEKSVRLVIAGPPKQLIEQEGLLDDELVLYFGELRPDEAAELAATADLGLLPLENNLFNQSRFPIKFFDFLSVGTPVYLSDVGEVGKLATNKQIGAIAVPVGKDNWVNGLLPTIERLRTSGRTIDTQLLYDSCGWSAIGVKLLNAYQEKKMNADL
jgi:glycosyltransferase involved in cell wall biosynthesis